MLLRAATVLINELFVWDSSRSDSVCSKWSFYVWWREARLFHFKIFSVEAKQAQNWESEKGPDLLKDYTPFNSRGSVKFFLLSNWVCLRSIIVYYFSKQIAHTHWIRGFRLQNRLWNWDKKCDIDRNPFSRFTEFYQRMQYANLSQTDFVSWI